MFWHREQEELQKFVIISKSYQNISLHLVTNLSLYRCCELNQIMVC